MNLNLPGYTELRERDVGSDFLSSDTYRSIGLTKQLHVNINTLECQDYILVEEYNNLVTDAERIMERCPAVEIVTVREPSGMDKRDILNVMQWSSKVVKLPRLKILFIDPVDRRRFRSQPDDQYIARIENLYCEKGRQKGLECLSVQNCDTRMSNEDFSLQGPFLQKTLVDNINSLNRLWFYGSELQATLRGMPTASLADMRLKSLSIRYLPTTDDFIRVFGL